MDDRADRRERVRLCGRRHVRHAGRGRAGVLCEPVLDARRRHENRRGDLQVPPRRRKRRHAVPQNSGPARSSRQSSQEESKGRWARALRVRRVRRKGAQAQRRPSPRAAIDGPRGPLRDLLYVGHHRQPQRRRDHQRQSHRGPRRRHRRRTQARAQQRGASVVSAAAAHVRARRPARHHALWRRHRVLLGRSQASDGGHQSAAPDDFPLGAAASQPRVLDGHGQHGRSPGQEAKVLCQSDGVQATAHGERLVLRQANQQALALGPPRLQENQSGPRRPRQAHRHRLGAHLGRGHAVPPLGVRVRCSGGLRRVRDCRSDDDHKARRLCPRTRRVPSALL
eukprot:Amastigsp_a182067_10.p3 type:complete len:338 gc:universal Amastigsp_a182067_10:1759-746(-)